MGGLWGVRADRPPAADLPARPGRPARLRLQKSMVSDFAVFGFCNHGAGPPQHAAPRSPTAIVSQLRAARRSQVGFYWVMHFVMRLGWYLSGNTDSRSDAFGLSQVRKQKLAKTRANAEAMQKSSSRSLLVAGSSYGLGIDKTDMEEESCGLPAYGGGTSAKRSFHGSEMKCIT